MSIVRNFGLQWTQNHYNHNHNERASNMSNHVPIIWQSIYGVPNCRYLRNQLMQIMHPLSSLMQVIRPSSSSRVHVIFKLQITYKGHSLKNIVYLFLVLIVYSRLKFMCDPSVCLVLTLEEYAPQQH